MAKQQPIDRARDELFSHIHRCGVLKATPADQDSWMTETMGYLAERYPDLGEKELFHLKKVGLQFCKPVISRLKHERPKEEGNGLDEAVPSDAVPSDAASSDAALQGGPNQDTVPQGIAAQDVLGEPLEA